MATVGYSTGSGSQVVGTKPKKMITPPKYTYAGGKAGTSIPRDTKLNTNVMPPPSGAPPSPGLGAGSTAITPTAFQAANQPATGGNVFTNAMSSVPAAVAAASGDNSGYNNANTDAMTGAAAAYGYTPAGLASIYDNPSILTNDMLAAMGITNPGMGNQLAQYMDPAVAAQFILNRGKNSSDNDVINFANEYLQQMTTPGGRQPEMDRMVAEILKATGGDTSLLGAYLNSGLTPDQQVSAANSLLGQTLSGQSPYAQTGYQRYEKDQGNKYLGQVAKGDPNATSYIDFLGNTPLAGWVRGS